MSKLTKSIKDLVGKPCEMIIGVVADLSALPEVGVNVRGTVVQLSKDANYAPALGDNVYILRFADSWIVVGRIG